MTAVGVVIATIGFVRFRPPMRWRCVAFGIGLAVDPLVAIAAVTCVFAFERFRKLARAKAERVGQRHDEILAVELVAAGVSAGVSFDSAVVAAAGHVDETVAHDMVRWLRLVRHGHQPPDADSVIAEMIRIAHASESSGAKVADQLVSLAENELSLDEASTNERLARLPIKMLFPLALLILPGFLLVTVAPAVVSGISKLGL